MARIVWLTGLAVVIALAAQDVAEGDGPWAWFDRIEEDWELVISEPNPDDESPQILNVFSPSGNQDNDFYIFELNHRTQPEYFSGGLQLQRWNGDFPREWTVFPSNNQLATPEETITYTLRMRLLDDYLWISVRDGHSQTWGDFSSTNGGLRIGQPTSLWNLNGYNTANSVAKSRIGYASYRVARFVLKEVRYYSNGDLVYTDETDRIVHEYQP